LAVRSSSLPNQTPKQVGQLSVWIEPQERVTRGLMHWGQVGWEGIRVGYGEEGRASIRFPPQTLA
jgi:hypothetical protein